MVLRIIIFLLGVVGFIQAQDLFYTDSYHTNLYQHHQDLFIFDNNIFSLLDHSTQTEVYTLMADYFEEIQVAAQLNETANEFQVRYSYSSPNFTPIQWSKIWHQKYGQQLTEILNSFTKTYFQNELQIPSSIADAAVHKHAYYNLETFNAGISNFTKTTLQISVQKVDQEEFINTYLEPNLSLNRLVTKSFGNYYNEAYPVQEIEVEKTFIFGPSNQARLKDCLSLYLYTRINLKASFVFLKDHTVLIDDSLSKVPLTEDFWKLTKPALKQQMIKDINSMDLSFYNIADKRNINKLFSEYAVEDYSRFLEIYTVDNSLNIAIPPNQIYKAYNKQVLEEQVFFNANDTSFKSLRDTMILNSLANFLNANPIDHILILGFAGKVEYDKIDRANYEIIINKYREYPPVETSKSPDLSIYRAVVVFDYLAQKGIHPSRMSCLSKNIKGEELSSYAYCKFSKR